MDRIVTTEIQSTTDEQEFKAPPIFGLRYLEEEAAEIHDIVGCNMTVNWDPSCQCDDHLPIP